jgi:hypothetical protein
MEFESQGKDIKEVKKNKSLDYFLKNWRQSEFYEWVHKILDNELNQNYTKDSVASNYLNEIPMTKDEIADAMIIEVQASARISSIKEALK